MLDGRTYPGWKHSCFFLKSYFWVVGNAAAYHLGPVKPSTADGAPLDYIRWKHSLRWQQLSQIKDRLFQSIWKNIPLETQQASAATYKLTEPPWASNPWLWLKDHWITRTPATFYFRRSWTRWTIASGVRSPSTTRSSSSTSPTWRASTTSTTSDPASFSRHPEWCKAASPENFSKTGKMTKRGTKWELRSTEEAFLLPTHKSQVGILAPPIFFSLHCLVCGQYWDRIHLVLNQWFHKCS